MIAKLKSEPAVVIGTLAAVILAVVQTLAGRGVIDQNIVDTVAGALDPTKGGWLIPLIVGLVTRAFVSPATKP
jgi:hypothetical protein